MIVFPSVANAFWRIPRQSATPMLPPSLQASLEMGEAAAQVTSLSKLPVCTRLSPICLYTTLAWFALSSCCRLYLCHSICPHTSFQTGFCCFLLFFFLFSLFFLFLIFFPFLAPCSCCFPHTHVSLTSLSHLTLNIKCPQSQRGICSLRRLLQVPTALQLHQHRAQANQSILQGFLEACSLWKPHEAL